MQRVTLGGVIAAGRVALVDDADFDLVSAINWQVQECVRPDRKRLDGPYAAGNVMCGGRRRRMFMHTLLTGWPRTDHINHDGLDNRRENLRPATAGQNGANMRAPIGTASPFKGVSWDRTWNHWVARIRVDGRLKFLGTYRDDIDAARAYDAAALAAFGEYAHLNFPRS